MKILMVKVNNAWCRDPLVQKGDVVASKERSASRILNCWENKQGSSGLVYVNGYDASKYTLSRVIISEGMESGDLWRAVECDDFGAPVRFLNRSKPLTREKVAMNKFHSKPLGLP